MITGKCGFGDDEMADGGGNNDNDDGVEAASTCKIPVIRNPSGLSKICRIRIHSGDLVYHRVMLISCPQTSHPLAIHLFGLGCTNIMIGSV